MDYKKLFALKPFNVMTNGRICGFGQLVFIVLRSLL